ncbi:MAG TPA: divergent polysaccharide deacetylase family protein [Candidatus Binatia bacterium]|nr:divergent polysaccharide deacetylase family protein [Candidatus Binatia bacterium]
MTKRRARKSSRAPAGPLARLKKKIGTGFAALLALRWAHSAIFVIGIAIGLALGLGLGLGYTWLQGRMHHAAAPSPVAMVAPQPPVVTTQPTLAPALTVAPTPPPQAQAPASIPPAYVEETEPSTDDTSTVDTPPLPATPPPPTQEPPQPSFTPAPQAANPSPANPAPAVTPEWLKNAVASIDPGDRPAIAIVLDDVGVAPSDVAGAVALPAPVTLSIMTYAQNAPRVAEAAHQAGHEIIVHVPMEPVNRDADPGPHALLTGLPAAELQQRLDWGLAQFPGYVGINNHMGSKFTQDPAGMRVVLEVLKARGLLFLDSRTIANSVGDQLAAELGVTHLKRDVFLDNVIDEADIMKALAKTEAVARKQGFAIAIGHPHPDTVAALRRWIPEAKARGFILVPLSEIAKKQMGVTG